MFLNLKGTCLQNTSDRKWTARFYEGDERESKDIDRSTQSTKWNDKSKLKTQGRFEKAFERFFLIMELM